MKGQGVLFIKTLLFLTATLGGAVVKIAAQNLWAEFQPVITCIKQMQVPHGIDLLTGSDGMIGHTGQKAEFTVLLQGLGGELS